MQALSCYNEATKNALAVLQTPESVAELVTGLKENKSDMPQDTTHLSTSTKEIPLTNGMVALVDADDFDLVRGYRWNPVRSTKAAATLYARTALRGKDGYYLKMHILILGKMPGKVIDHINGNGLDNRRCNLRHVTVSQNQANSAKHIKGSSSFKGVSWVRRDSRWKAQITVNYRSIWLGSFESAEEAARAYDDAAMRHFGECARVNFPHAHVKEVG
jgi:hypothetical protein